MYILPCYHCLGDGCPECGNGEWHPMACPHDLNTGTMDEVMEAIAHKDMTGLMPAPGGSLDQPAIVLEAMSTVYKVKAWVEQRNLEAEKAKQR